MVLSIRRTRPWTRGSSAATSPVTSSTRKEQRGVDRALPLVARVDVHHVAAANRHAGALVDVALEGHVLEVVVLDRAGALDLDEVPLLLAGGQQHVGPGEGGAEKEPRLEDGAALLQGLEGAARDLAEAEVPVDLDGVGEEVVGQLAHAVALVEAEGLPEVGLGQAILGVVVHPEESGALEADEVLALGEDGVVHHSDPRCSSSSGRNSVITGSALSPGPHSALISTILSSPSI